MKGNKAIRHLQEIWEHRQLIGILAVSDFKLRYKNSVLGFFWSLLEPLLMLLVLYVVFTNIMRLSVEHYQLFLLLGIVMWGLLAKGTSTSLEAIVGKANLVKKAYFPREVLVFSSCITALMMTALEFVVFMVFMIVFGVVPGFSVVIFPIAFVLAFVMVVGLSLGLAGLNVYYRDVRYIWAVVLQAGFFATPIIYPITIISPSWQQVFMLNPMAQVLEISRGTLIYETLPTLTVLIYVAVFSIGTLATGWFIFNRLEPRFAEEI